METTFTCSCGEIFQSEQAAWSCNKCPQYLMEKDFLNRKVLRIEDEIGTVLDRDTEEVCENCGQWKRQSNGGDCFNRCVARGFAN